MLCHRHDNQAVHPVAPHDVQTVFFLLTIVIRVKQNQTVALFSRRLLHVFLQIREKGVGDIGQHHADELGSAAHQPPGHGIGLKIMFSGASQHFFPHLRFHGSVAVQHPGYGRLRHAGEAGDFGHCNHGLSLLSIWFSSML